MNETGIEKKSIEKEFARSRIAVLGLLADLHREPTQYDLRLLRRLVKNIRPDLLCAEIHLDDWRSGDLSAIWPEYRDTLLPLARRTDIIVVPVGGSNGYEIQIPGDGLLMWLRRLVVRLINGLQRLLMRLARRPDDVNGGTLDALCDGMCAAALGVSGPQARQAWDEANQAILNNILAAAHRDPQRRVLVTVDCRRRRWLIDRLLYQPEVDVVDYRSL